MVKDVLQQRHVVVAASWSPFKVLIHQDQITQSTFLAPDLFPLYCLLHKVSQISQCGAIALPSHTTRRAGPHRAVHLLAVSFCQIVNRFASPCPLMLFLGSGLCRRPSERQGFMHRLT